MLYYSNHWVEIEGLLEQDVSAHDWWRVLQSDQYLMKQTPYGWIACDGAICNSKRIRRIDYVAKALENEMSFNDIIHTNKLSPYIKSALLENKLIALNSDFDLKWIGKNFSSVSKDDAQKYNSLVADNIAYIDKSNSINSKIVIKKGTTCQLHCRVHPHYNTRKPIMEIDLYIGKYYNERYDLMFTRIFENVDFEKINATFS